MKMTLLASFVVAALATCAGSANAAPIGADQSRSGGWITKVAIGECRRDERGWHRMRGERRENCRATVGSVKARVAAGGIARRSIGTTAESA